MPNVGQCFWSSENCKEHEMTKATTYPMKKKKDKPTRFSQRLVAKKNESVTLKKVCSHVVLFQIYLPLLHGFFVICN